MANSAQVLPQMTEASSCDLEHIHTEEVLGHMGNVRFSGLALEDLWSVSYFPPCYRAFAGCLLHRYGPRHMLIALGGKMQGLFSQIPGTFWRLSEQSGEC